MEISRSRVGAEPLLDPAEERFLANQIEAGLLAREARLQRRYPHQSSEDELLILEDLGERARQRYIRANLRLVAMVARRDAVRSGLPEADLFQEGCLGLIHAVQRFDQLRGCRFATYALFWIRAQIGAATASRCGEMNLPTHRAENLRQVRGVQAELSQTLGRSALLIEVAAFLGKSYESIAELLAYQSPQSIESAGNYALEMVDIHAADEFEAVLQQSMPGEELLVHLDGLQREVIMVRFGFRDGWERSYAETARLLALSVTQVRRHEAKALEALRMVCPHGAYVHL